jgi:outer membrane protein
MRSLILAAILPVAAGAQAASATGPRPVTLEEAIRLAQQNAPQTVAARNRVNSTSAAVRQAWGTFLPSLNVSQGASHSGGRTFFQGQLVDYNGPPWSFNRSLSSSLVLFDAGQRNFALSAARANVAAAEADLRSQRYAVALSVTQQYYNVLAARESRAASEAQLQQALEQQKSANARVAAGAATKSDSLQSVISVGQAQLAILTSENDLQNANASLTRLVATPFIVTATASDSLRAEAFDVDSSSLMTTIDATPAVNSALAAVSAARSSSKAARTPYFPRLNLNLSMGGSRTADSFDWGVGTYSQSKSAGFSLSLAIFNGFQRETQIINASIAERNALAELRDIRLLTQQQLVSFLGSLRLADAQIRIQQTSVEAAQEVVRVQQQRYNLGASTLLELVTAQAQLNSARLALIRARQTARIARANIENLLGRPLQ